MENEPVTEKSNSTGENSPKREPDLCPRCDREYISERRQAALAKRLQGRTGDLSVCALCRRQHYARSLLEVSQSQVER